MWRIIEKDHIGPQEETPLSKKKIESEKWNKISQMLIIFKY